ncbi:hypothetical protein D9M72_325010 [compost metagenome]
MRDQGVAVQRHDHVEGVDLRLQRHHQPDLAAMRRQAGDQVVHDLLRFDHQRAHRRDGRARAQRHQHVVARGVGLAHDLRQPRLGGRGVQFDLRPVAHARGEPVLALAGRQGGKRRGVQAVQRAEFVDTHVRAQKRRHFRHHVAARRLPDGEERHAPPRMINHAASPASRPTVCKCAIEP